MGVPRPRRPLPVLAVAIAGILLAAASWVSAGEDDAPALIEKTRALLADSDVRGIARLVAADRAGAYEAVDRLLNQGNADDRPVEDALARAYAEGFRDDSLRERTRTFRSWTPAQRSARDAALRLKETGKKDAVTGRYARAVGGFQKALSVFRSTGDLREEARCLSNLGAMAAEQGDGEAALARLNEARAAVGKSGDLALLAAIETNRSVVFSGRGDLQEARTALESALSVARALAARGDEAAILVNLGQLEDDLGDTTGAIAHTEKASQAGRELGDARLESRALQNLGSMYGHLGDHRRGADSQRKAAEVARRAGLPKEEADSLLNLTEWAITERDFPLARQSLDQARPAAAATDSVFTRSRVEMAAAHLENEQGRFAAALPFLDAAEKNLAGAEAPSLLGRIHGERSVTFFYLGRYEEAVAECERAIRYIAAAADPKNEALFRTNLGQFLALLGEPRRGLEELQAASHLYRTAGDPHGEALTLQTIGMIRFQRGETAAGRAALQAALASLRDTPRAAERAEAMTDLAALEIASGPAGRESGLRLAREAAAIFAAQDDQHGIAYAGILEAEVSLQEGEVSRARGALEQIHRLARGRANVEFGWRILFLEGRAAEASGDLPSARRLYRRSVAEVERLRLSVRPLPWRAAIQEDRIAPYRALVRLLRRRGEVEEAYRIARAAKARTFSERLAQLDLASDLSPSPAALGSGPAAEPVASLDRLQRLLAEREALLDYFVDEEDLLVFVVRREGIRLRSIPLADPGPDTLSGTLRALRYPGRPEPGDAPVTEAWRRAAVRAGQALMQPIAADLAGCDQLLVVPAGPIQGVPFAALEWEGRPLVEGWTIALLPAAESLFSREAPRGDLPPTILAMGDAGQQDLPGAEEEARRIATLAPGRVDVVTGAAAREAVFRKTAAGYGGIHLAAHGRIDPISPAHSYIALTPGDGEDGRLEAAEIAALSIRTPLVVLSGCETGVEQGTARGDAPGEERTGLARAFLAAGAGTVIASLWEMEDRSARRVMPEIYPRLAHLPAAAALAQLQRDLLHGKIRGEGGRSLAHPFYWAGLAAFGAGESQAPLSQ